MEKDMIETKSPLRNDNGSALVVTILIIAVTLVMGILATTSTMNELQIAGSDIQQKLAFYEADGATEYSAQLLEENIACSRFQEDPASVGQATIGDVRVEKLAFWVIERNGEGDTEETPDPRDDDEANVAFFFPVGAAADEPRTEVFLAGNTGYLKGSAMQLAAGYEGIGKGSAGSGVGITYDIIHRRKVMEKQPDGTYKDKTAASVTIGWGHITGQEEDCKY